MRIKKERRKIKYGKAIQKQVCPITLLYAILTEKELLPHIFNCT